MRHVETCYLKKVILHRRNSLSIESFEVEIKLRLSLSNGIFAKYPLEENIASVSKLGFENLEFNMKSVEVEDDVAVYAAKRLVDAYGLKCLTLHAATLHVKDEVEVHRAVYYGKISLEFAQLLQAPVMVVHSNIARKLPEALRPKVLASVFSELTAYAKRLNVKLALENLSYASTGYGKNVAELEEILGIVDDGTMGVTLDFCHAEATGQTMNLFEKYRNKLYNIHISNRAHKSFDVETPQLKTFLAKLQGYGYSGPLTMELSRKCTAEQVLKTKTVLEKTLSQN
jgi:sugar phosphate isomerase/epimerase